MSANRIIKNRARFLQNRQVLEGTHSLQDELLGFGVSFLWLISVGQLVVF